MAPYPQPRPRHLRNGQAYVPKEFREKRLELQAHMIRLTAGSSLLQGPLAVEIGFFRPKKRDRRKDGDVDNYMKAVLDAGNAVLWVDDRQIVDLHGYLDDNADEGRVELVIGAPACP